MPVTLKEAFEILSQRKACTQLEILKEIVNESLELIKDSAHNRRLGNNLEIYFSYYSKIFHNFPNSNFCFLKYKYC